LTLNIESDTLRCPSPGRCRNPLPFSLSQ
jgi:hypothetical protein